jgi:hypothetical protein
MRAVCFEGVIIEQHLHAGAKLKDEQVTTLSASIDVIEFNCIEIVYK